MTKQKLIHSSFMYLSKGEGKKKGEGTCKIYGTENEISSCLTLLPPAPIFQCCLFLFFLGLVDACFGGCCPLIRQRIIFDGGLSLSLYGARNNQSNNP